MTDAPPPPLRPAKARSPLRLGLLENGATARLELDMELPAELALEIVSMIKAASAKAR